MEEKYMCSDTVKGTGCGFVDCQIFNESVGTLNTIKIFEFNRRRVSVKDITD